MEVSYCIIRGKDFARLENIRCCWQRHVYSADLINRTYPRNFVWMQQLYESRSSVDYVAPTVMTVRLNRNLRMIEVKSSVSGWQVLFRCSILVLAFWYLMSNAVGGSAVDFSSILMTSEAASAANSLDRPSESRTDMIICREYPLQLFEIWRFEHETYWCRLPFTKQFNAFYDDRNPVNVSNVYGEKGRLTSQYISEIWRSM